ncbi:TlpA disulfide reductase family protein [Aquisalibacillus elongatus]|uniref:Peroxiredoxin n=1 Tax=Aquisalibacillus elongatus TaxID=485577 RepID=A0A3N5BGM0_9BACI|nr:TlpA disulfide reductase family protein [Aquisalibacillus elongatus]RPF55899.1 peroxiredoxin [Aquisalibacillus elongatus]
MKKYIILLVVIAMFGFAVYDLVGSTNEGEKDENSDDGGFMMSTEPDDESVEDAEVGLEVGSQAPDFELKTLEGETVKLSDYRGKRVMLNFWATWCPPCRAEMPDMQKFYEEKDVEILAVNLYSTEDSMEDVEEFVDEFGLTFQIPIDEDDDVSIEYQIMAYPTSYFVDSQGIIRHKSMGAMNYEMMIQEYEKMD